MEREWERRRLAEARAGLVRENQIAREREELRKQLANENKQPIKEQRSLNIHNYLHIATVPHITCNIATALHDDTQ